jgi:Protein of unknown function (DUF2793)
MMPGVAGPRIGFVWGYSAGENGWGIGGFNPNFLRLEALLHLTITSITATPPGSPANGDCYIVAVGGTGVFSGHDRAVAAYFTTGTPAWSYFTPTTGMRAFNRATTTYWRYSGTDWIEETEADVTGPGSAVDGNFAMFDGSTGQLLADSGKFVPIGDVVGTTDTQILTNKVIDGALNALTVHLSTDVVDNLPIYNLGGGAGAGPTTAWFGDGTWKHVNISEGPVIVADVPPVSPLPNDLWFDSADTMALYLYYDDGTSQQWIAV